MSPFFGHDFVAKNWALSKFEAAARCVGQVLSPFSGHDSWTIFIQNLWTAHVYFRELRRYFCLVPSVGDRSQPMTLLLLAHAACPQQDCPPFAGFLELLHATCDVVRGWRSLSEGSATPDRRWMTTECRWASFTQMGLGGPVCDVFRRFSERFFVGQAAWHACKLSTEAAGGGFEDCERRVVSSTEGSRKLQQSEVAVLTPSTHGSGLGCLLPASWPPAAACLLLAVRVAA